MFHLSRILLASLFLLFIPLSLSSQPVSAVDYTITVDRFDDPSEGGGFCVEANDNDCSLRGAIGWIAANGDTYYDSYTITLPEGSFSLAMDDYYGEEDYNVTGDLDIDFPVTIQGAGAGTVINAATDARAFHLINAGLPADMVVTIRDLTIRGGNVSTQGGGILNGGATLYLNNVVVDSNVSVQQGGGVANLGGILNVTTSAFTNNAATEGTVTNDYRECGGAIYNGTNGTLIVDQSTFTTNDAPGPAGVFAPKQAVI